MFSDSSGRRGRRSERRDRMLASGTESRAEGGGSLPSTFRKLWDLLTPRERRHAYLLLLVMLGLGVIETAGVASILPLIAVLAEPSIVETNPLLSTLYQQLGFASINVFFVFLSLAVFAVIVARTVFAIAGGYGMLRFVQMSSHSLSVRLLSSFLRRPYVFFLDRHSADMGKSILSEVEQVINDSLMPALQLISKLIIIAALACLVILVEPGVAIAAIVGLFVSYGLVYLFIRGYLQRKGAARVEANRARYQIAQEVLGGVKEVKVGGHELGYISRFRRASLRFARLRTQLSLISEVPRHMLELIAVGGTLILILVLLFRADGQLSAALPVIALYAFAGLRLLPAIQTIYRSLISLRFGDPALELLHKELLETHEADLTEPAEALPLKREIALDNVVFSYPTAGRPTLRDVSLTIPAHSTAALVGPTGAGKSTIVDIILGLLEPQQGQIAIDGVPITNQNVRSWQRSIGYVPQQIFLADESVAANIALGVPPEEIDLAAVERASRLASLHEFVVNELPHGYDTEIGDRGVRLSGGQRQRIGIARALYNDPDVLILDEATSALDNLTERAVMEAVANLAKQKTLILIAHRLTTVKSADKVFFINEGAIDGAAPYEQLRAEHAGFAAFAETDYESPEFAPAP